MSEINKKLSAIQQELKAPKNQVNKFGNYNYRSCEDILESVKPLLDGLTLRIDDKIVQVGDRYYVKATAILSDGDEAIVAQAYAREAENKKGMDESQITGAASSYARKYALNGLFAIDDTKDADSKDNTVNTESKSVSEKNIDKPASAKQIGMIQAIADNELGYSNLLLSKITTKHYKKGRLPDLTMLEASDLIGKLQDQVEKEKKSEDVDPDEIAEALEGYDG